MAKPSLTLTHRVPSGRYTLRVRLLETVTAGLAQGSTVVKKRLRVEAGR